MDEFLKVHQAAIELKVRSFSKVDSSIQVQIGVIVN